MRRFLLSVAMIAAIGSAAPAQADSYTGNDLTKWCDSEYQSYDGLCRGFIAATTDAWLNSLLIANKESCLNPAITYGQIIDVVKKYLHDNPATRHKSAYGLTIQALYKGFCAPQTSAPG
jgi:hypothetical protein